MAMIMLLIRKIIGSKKMNKHHGKDNIYYRISTFSPSELKELEPIWRGLSAKNADNPRSPYHHQYYALMVELEKREEQQRESTE